MIHPISAKAKGSNWQSDTNGSMCPVDGHRNSGHARAVRCALFRNMEKSSHSPHTHGRGHEANIKFGITYVPTLLLRSLCWWYDGGALFSSFSFCLAPSDGWTAERLRNCCCCCCYHSVARWATACAIIHYIPPLCRLNCSNSIHVHCWKILP